ncbi:Rrf2 family transcriptional regulator [candidate division WOR-3 bacterium]|uniref:Rrf2 family transcriptional regulator n=1 Tax=candidate division WOR-3 bacterium TaxID=2052148 RepID=A0A9D5QC24_UNCW3|nr:Rrf2 family transcriptional regulator [candidate division WOR-3 bacterium]MBD3363597.1 Rrf2 family transcriptional regulator [candidate division WOR-3 bacterium]
MVNRLNTTIRYAVRAVLVLASHRDNPISIKEISEHEDLSVKYLEQLFLKLRKAGLVKSVRGMYGGYFLARPPDKISLGDVIKAVQPNGVYAAPCTRKSKHCIREKNCSAHEYWEKLRALLDDFFASTTLATLKD